MNLKCVVGIHEWSGCKCLKCGKTRDQGHDWAFDCEKCNTCGSTRSDGHDWTADCKKCMKCGKTREEPHDWTEDCEKCAKCGKTRDEEHTWTGLRCKKCDKSRNTKAEIKKTLNFLDDVKEIDNYLVQHHAQFYELIDTIMDETLYETSGQSIFGSNNRQIEESFNKLKYIANLLDRMPYDRLDSIIKERTRVILKEIKRRADYAIGPGLTNIHSLTVSANKSAAMAAFSGVSYVLFRRFDESEQYEWNLSWADSCYKLEVIVR